MTLGEQQVHNGRGRRSKEKEDITEGYVKDYLRGGDWSRFLSVSSRLARYMISGFRVLFQAIAPLARLEPMTEGSCQISGWVNYSLYHQGHCAYGTARAHNRRFLADLRAV
ncbi:hypothetical protein PoB_002473600 [Plakobranchus ocellatus]|uniref:Uncharacterized protein n=1 Tax=Plakobranchus ocellatus TaxID=259542 RepID=A0AAV3ZUP7_9GAST|nr:hypothetical protein PoB_002473600 [Plakobranchus ocellatus]